MCHGQNQRLTDTNSPREKGKDPKPGGGGGGIQATCHFLQSRLASERGHTLSAPTLPNECVWADKDRSVQKIDSSYRLVSLVKKRAHFQPKRIELGVTQTKTSRLYPFHQGLQPGVIMP